MIRLFWLMISTQICWVAIRTERSINLHELNIARQDLIGLDAPVSRKEVWETMKQLPSDKAQGQMILHVAFIKLAMTSLK